MEHMSRDSKRAATLNESAPALKRREPRVEKCWLKPLSSAMSPSLSAKSKTSERTVRLNDDLLVLAEIQHAPAMAERAPLDLIHGGHLAAGLREPPDLFSCVITHADVPGKAVPFRLDEPFPQLFARATRRCS